MAIEQFRKIRLSAKNKEKLNNILSSSIEKLFPDEEEKDKTVLRELSMSI